MSSNYRQSLARLGSALLALVLAACTIVVEETPSVSPPPDELVASFLMAAGGAEPDRGWSLLHPFTRAEMFGDDRELYIELARDETWAGLDWTILQAVPDDPSRYFVQIDFAAERLPAVLTEPHNSFFLIDRSDTISLLVRYDALGTGIWPRGG